MRLNEILNPINFNLFKLNLNHIFKLSSSFLSIENIYMQCMVKNPENKEIQYIFNFLIFKFNFFFNKFFFIFRLLKNIDYKIKIIIFRSINIFLEKKLKKVTTKLTIIYFLLLLCQSNWKKEVLI
jgi:hypothetical protein